LGNLLGACLAAFLTAAVAAVNAPVA
jgi:hypothetical protein